MVSCLNKDSNNQQKLFLENLASVLKQTDIIFCETRAITETNMKLTHCYVGGYLYGDMKNETKDNNNKSLFHINGDTRASEILSLSKSRQNIDFHQSLMENSQEAKLLKFFLISTICHNAQVEINPLSGEIQYTNTVIDLPLIEGAKAMGFVLTNRTSDSIEVKNEYNQQTYKWEILHYLPFDSLRKKTSIIVKKANCHLNKIYLFTKGSPEVIMPIVSQESDYLKVREVINKFCSNGQRTGVLTMKILEQNEFSDWLTRVNEAYKIENEEERCKKISQLYSLIEKDLNISGIYSQDYLLRDSVYDFFRS